MSTHGSSSAPRSDAPNEPPAWMGVLLRILISPVLAWTLLASRSPYPDMPRGLIVLGHTRNIAATVVVLGAAIYWDPTSLWDYPRSTGNAVSNAALLGMGIAALACLATFPFVRQGSRAAAAIALTRPLRRIAILVVVLIVLRMLGIVFFSWDGLPPAEMGAGASGEPFSMNEFGISILRNIASLWAIGFIVTAVFIVSSNLFALGDAHPRLASVGAVALTGTLLVVEIAGALGIGVPLLLDAGGASIPPIIGVLFTFCGVSTTVALSYAEWRWWGRQGFLLRSGRWL